MNGFYVFDTKAGQFRIAEINGRWHALFQDERLGNYVSPRLALDDLAGGHTDWPSCGDPSQFDLPADISAWRFVPRR